jgi:WD40 repeat protein
VSESVAGDEKKFPHALTAMALDFINERLYVGSADGSINILSCDNRNLQIVHSIVPLSRNQISCLFLTQKNQFLIAGTERGFVKIFEVRKPGKEKLTSIISTIELPQAVRSVAFSLTQKELYVTHSGSIVIINS